MSSPPQSRWFDVEQVGGVAVVRFICHGYWDDPIIQGVGKDLNALAERSPSPRILLDMSSVESLASVMFSKLVMLNRKVRAAGGRLALCKLTTRVREIIDLLKLDQLLNIYDGEAEALQSFAGG